MRVELGKPTLVYCAPINEATLQWGVYAIPKMWRNYTGELVIRFNGEQDSGLTQQRAENLYFISKDDGKTWNFVKDGEGKFDLNFIGGVNPPFLKLENGDLIGIRYKDGLKPITNVKHIKEYPIPNFENIIYIYKYGDIPKECKELEIMRISNGEKTFNDVTLDFPEREIMVNAKGFYKMENDQRIFKDMPQYLQSNIFSSPYLTGLNQLKDGTLVALSHGQTPSVEDRQCEDAYLMASTDGGITWTKRGTVASEPNMHYGCCGDGAEMSLTVAENGDLLCVMRTEITSKDPCDLLLCRSADNGYTWTKPEKIADSSVTPHIMALKDGIVVAIYGRPGVHFKVSQDNGKTWSKSYSIIGKTLEEELASGKEYRDCKYGDTSSYSNTFIEKLSDDTILVLYNDLKYDPGDGKNHKAGLVRAITVKGPVQNAQTTQSK